MKFYPINLNLQNKKVLIVGAGKVAFRKFIRLKKAGALIKVVSPQFNDLFADYLGQNSEKYKFIKRKFKKSDLNNIFLVFAAADNSSVNKRISFLAEKENILINSADSAANSDFTLPAVVEQGELMLTVSTGAKLPALSKKIRRELEKNYKLEYKLLLALMAEKRKYIIENIKEEKLRREIFKKAASEEFLDKIRTIINKNEKAIKNKKIKLDELNHILQSELFKELEKELSALIAGLKNNYYKSD